MKFYRYAEEFHYCEDRLVFKIHEKDFLTVFELVKETKKGYWIRKENCKFCKQKWISKTSRKKFAYLTKGEAIESFYHRKLSHVKHSLYRLKRAEAGLAIAKTLYYEFKNEASCQKN